MEFTPFVKEALDKLEPKEKRYHIADPKTAGLKLAIYPGGAKTFFLDRKVKGKHQKIKIGSYSRLSIENARKRAKDLNAQIELGNDPHKEKIEARNAMTVRELYEHYYKGHAIKLTKRPEENRKTFEKHILPIWGSRKAHEITQQDARNLHAAIGQKESRYSKPDLKKKSHGSANRIFTIVSAVFNFGIKEGHVNGSNPCVGLKKNPAVSRDRFFDLGELKLFFSALNAENKTVADLFKTFLYTGARKSNVLKMEYTALNFDFRRWRLPETQTKNREVNVVSLSDPAYKILITRAAFNEFYKSPSRYVFPGEGKDGYFRDPKKAFTRIKTRMNVFDIRIHDLRRTFGSYMAITNASMPIIGKALNHKSQVSTGIYARLSNDPVLAAINTATDLINDQKTKSWPRT
ncbi:site-specific integrase [Mucilaginibacter sp. BJC16-A38]|uniref:tyrosine-type recombinase/integrase n=1 Tax=Mucilaginibacter phenanthrenivorans TaxID=1234842 RepID=UPI00215747B3|nr:site-specific integrase [Mucilaginibacter phenanthrenivorans]MCR8561058.1 site-specific integrase [Mucilaginibacter phenanthrenivorans]